LRDDVQQPSVDRGKRRNPTEQLRQRNDRNLRRDQLDQPLLTRSRNSSSEVAMTTLRSVAHSSALRDIPAAATVPSGSERSCSLKPGSASHLSTSRSTPLSATTLLPCNDSPWS